MIKFLKHLGAVTIVVLCGLFAIQAVRPYVVAVSGPTASGLPYVQVCNAGDSTSNDCLATVNYVAAGTATLSNKTLASPTLTGTISATGTLTVNGGTADQDTTIYGNNSTAVVTVDAGNLRVGINDATPSVALDVGGTANIQSDADVAGTLNADTLDVDGAANFAVGITMAGGTASSGGNVPYVVNVDTGTSVDNGTTAKMISQWGFSTDELVAGNVVRLNCSGTGSGANGTKTLYLMCGTTVTTGIVQTAAATNATWQLQMNIAVVSDTSEKVWGSWISDGATIEQTTYEATDCDISAGETISLYVDLANTGDVVQKEVCIWELLP